MDFFQRYLTKGPFRPGEAAEGKEGDNEIREWLLRCGLKLEGDVTPKLKKGVKRSVTKTPIE
jgi:hypothetical protein